MAKKKGNVYGQVVVYEKTYKGTSIGRRPNTSSMNKNRRRNFKKYRGQGRWKDQTFILMESLYHIRCHKILDQQLEVKAAAVLVGCFQEGMDFVLCIKQEV